MCRGFGQWCLRKSACLRRPELKNNPEHFSHDPCTLHALCGPPVLDNDLKELAGQQERGLHQLHAATATPATTPPAPAPLRQASPAFATVLAVVSGSPAAAGGLAVGDEVRRFGPVVAAEGSGDAAAALRALAAALPSLAGRRVEVMVDRPGSGSVTLLVTPGTWDGKGLLGATLQPLLP